MALEQCVFELAFWPFIRPPENEIENPYYR